MKIRTWPWVLAAAVIVTGCSGNDATPGTGSPTPHTSMSAAFSELIDKQIDDAQAAGVNQTQIAILEQARDAGVMSHELAMQGLHDYFDCLNDVGVQAELEKTQPTGDYPDILYRVYTTDTTVTDQCLASTYGYVDTVYQVQPAATAHKDQLRADHSADFRACLEDAGIVIPDGTGDLLLPGAVLAASDGFEPFEDALLPNGPVDCLTPFGLTADDL